MYNENHEKEVKSDLKLIKMYVVKSLFERKENVTSKDLNIKIKHEINKENGGKFSINLGVNIKNKDDTLNLLAEMIGIFESNNEALINENAISIMFPYLRSYVSTLTTQPDLLPIVLQPVNILSLLNK